MGRVGPKQTAAELLSGNPAARRAARDRALALDAAELGEVATIAGATVARARRRVAACRVAALVLVRAFWLLLLVAAACWMGHAPMGLLAWPATIIVGAIGAVMLVGWAFDTRRRSLEARLGEARDGNLGDAIRGQEQD